MAYEALASMVCSECEVEYSEPVGVLHARRTGHEVGRLPAWLLDAARERASEAEESREWVRQREMMARRMAA